MYSSNKRPTTSKPFNPSTTHPASIPNMPGSSTQKREHVSQSQPEMGQSGGGGGGGTGAGSGTETSAGEGEKELDSIARRGSQGKGIDSAKVHPGSVSGGESGSTKRESKL